MPNVETQCPSLVIDNGLLSRVGPYYPGDEVIFSCNNGYQIVGASSAACTNSGLWSKSTPSCQSMLTYAGKNTKAMLLKSL